MGFEPQRHAGAERHGGPMLPLGAFVSLWFTLSHYQTGTQEKAWGRGWKIPVFPEFVPDLPKTFLDAPEFVPDGPEFLPDRPKYFSDGPKFVPGRLEYFSDRSEFLPDRTKSFLDGTEFLPDRPRSFPDRPTCQWRLG
jgi:hypothetical protein